jgi:hypothetical protein
MPTEIISCPACRHDVQVPESLLGQPVRCPDCKAYFTAPLRDADGNLGPAELLQAVPPALPRRRPVERPVEAPSLLLPGILLLLVGVIGTLVNGVGAFQFWTQPEAAKRNMVAQLDQIMKNAQQNVNPNQLKETAEIMPLVVTVFFLISLAPLFGAIAMLRMRMWWLAMLGSLVAIINISNCCCVIGLPVGVYCLIRLFDSEVQMAFRRTDFPPPPE